VFSIVEDIDHLIFKCFCYFFYMGLIWKYFSWSYQLILCSLY